MKHTMAIALVLCLAIVQIGLVSTEVSAADLTELVSSCENCHDKNGASKDAEIPIIGGLSAQYIIDSFTAYQDKSRPCEEVKYLAGAHKGEQGDMCKVTKELSTQEIKQVAEHFAAKPFVRAKQAFDTELATKGKSVHGLHCKKCHEDGGSSPDDDAGILAGQWMHFLEEQFDSYAAGKREMPKKMKLKMDKLSGEDTKLLLHYYGSFQ